MKAFALALFAASTEAMMVTTVNSTAATSVTAFSTLSSATIEWGYDATNIYVNVETVSVIAAAAAQDTDKWQVGLLVPFHASNHWVIGCAISWNNSASTFTPTWLFMDPGAPIDLAGGATKVYTDTDNLGTAKFARGGSATAKNGENAMTTDAADGTNKTYHILKGSSAKLDTATTGLTCRTNAKLSGVADLATAAAINALIDTGLAASSSVKVFFGSTTTGSSTIEAKFQTVTTVSGAIAGTTAPSTSAVNYTGPGQVSTQISGVTHSVNTWTSTGTIYINFDMEITSKIAIADTKRHQAMTCAKIATTGWICAMMEVLGDGATSAQWTWKVFSGTATPAAFTANEKCDSANNLAKLATFVPEFVGKSNATIAAEAAAVQLTTKAGFRNNTKWAWSATANKMDSARKVLSGSLQYVSVEVDGAGAASVQAKISAYAATSWVGTYDDLSSANGAFGAKALAATAATAAAAAVVATGALQLASISAAIVLVAAF